jgi:hypothetical protein
LNYWLRLKLPFFSNLTSSSASGNNPLTYVISPRY